MNVPALGEGQLLHAVALTLLVALVHLATKIPAVSDAAGWLWLAVVIAVVHQVYVWLCWRLALAGRLTAFNAYAFGFATIGILRVAAVIAVGVAGYATLGEPSIWTLALGLAVFAPAAYLFWSVKRYFGFRRAFGADHFFPEYRTMPRVEQGIFRWTSNGMYAFGFLLLWAIAIWTMSAAALVAAAFNHAYIWVHWFATERPDMRRIYRASRSD